MNEPLHGNVKIIIMYNDFTLRFSALEQMKKYIQQSASKTCNLTIIINKSLETGSVPQAFKHAMVTSILKKEGLDTELRIIDQCLTSQISPNFWRK